MPSPLAGLALIGAALVSGCSDAAQVAAPPDPPSSPATSANATTALDDAMTRLLPALAEGGETAALEDRIAALQSRLESGMAAPIEELRSAALAALGDYRAGADAGFHPDADAVELALLAIAAR